MTIKKVHVVFKTHLDIGFTDYAANVKQIYMQEYLPKAITLAKQMRETGHGNRFIWTAGSWLIYEYLEQAGPSERKKMEEAIEAGDIVWHALPFTTHSELMDVSLFKFGLSLAQILDKRFGRHTIAAKMTDVPGHTIGIVPLLSEAGVQFLHVGVNGASTPPSVPPVFVWKATPSQSLIVMYHKGSYGATMTLPGLTEAIVFAHTGDNHGPQSAENVLLLYERLRAEFPQAEVVASTMDDYAHFLAKHKDELPIVTEEIGDTWIHGAGSDPAKVARFRVLCRLRAQWLREGRVNAADPAFVSFSRSLLMIPEHTWGMDIKKHLHDTTNYTPAQLLAVRSEPNFQKVSASWHEQREYINDAITHLGESELAREARAQLAFLGANQADMVPSRQADAGKSYSIGCIEIGFDTQTGAVNHLVDNATGRIWATQEHMLGSISMENFSQADYDRFVGQYLINLDKTREWAIPDFTKPGISAYVQDHRIWHPELTAIGYQVSEGSTAFRLEMQTPDEGVQRFGFPAKWVVEITVDERSHSVHYVVRWLGMQACRLPMAYWFSFCPVVTDEGEWRLDKLGRQISPLSVVDNGAKHLHAVNTGVTYREKDHGMEIKTLDAPLVAPGAPSLLNFDTQTPNLNKGMHFNLYNNIWGTNFPMWYEDDGLFRFELTIR